MKINFKNIAIIALTICPLVSPLAANNDYPKTREERKIDEMGSILGGEGISFKPSKVKNESTKKTSKNSAVNSYLWQAAVEVLNFAPLSSADIKGGVIITDWYIPKDNNKVNRKINVFIKDTVISPEAIEVKIFEKVIKNGHWIQDGKPSELTNILENKILHRARELYIASERK